MGDKGINHYKLNKDNNENQLYLEHVFLQKILTALTQTSINIRSMYQSTNTTDFFVLDDNNLNRFNF